MQVLIEENSNPTNTFNEFNVDTAERVADRNRRLLGQGVAVNWIVIGVAESPGAARIWLQSYRATRSSTN